MIQFVTRAVGPLLDGHRSNLAVAHHFSLQGAEMIRKSPVPRAYQARASESGSDAHGRSFLILISQKFGDNLLDHISISLTLSFFHYC